MTREEALNKVRQMSLPKETMEILETLAPELRRSDDERIRKEMIRYFTEIKKGGSAALPYDDCIAYLERQKETGIRWFKSDNVKNPDKPYIDKAGMFYTTDGRMCHASEIEKQKEQKPSQTDTEKEYVQTLKSLISDFLHGKQEIDTGYYQQICDWLDGRHIEQKVLPGFDGLTPEEKMNHPLYLEGFDVGRDVQKVFDEQKQECGEDDERILNELLDHCNTENATWYNWLKSLRPQPKQVWTEEDDRICHLIMANLSESARHAITLPIETVNDFNNWLRTLQCMPPVFTDWNEEDQTLLSDALGCVTMVQELKKRGKLKNFHISCSYDELRSWVRSLKSRPRKQPSWKPSEEQIKAVEHAYNSFPNDCPTKSNLRRLSFDLKKLR